jgi:predicted dehydrogenase
VTLRVAQVGIAHSHAAGRVQAYVGNPGVELVGVHEPFPSVRRERGAHPAYKEVRWLDAVELFGDSSIGAVSIETLPGENLRWAREALLAGKHVILEKAPGLNLQDLHDLFELAASKSLIVQLGYQFRFNAAFQLALRLARAGALGRLWRISGQIAANLPGYGRTGDVQNYPGGIWFTLGCHLLDQVVLLLGPPPEVRSILRRDHQPSGEFAFADNNLAVFEYDRALATIDTWNLEAGDNAVHRRFELYGERGTVLISPLEPPQVRLYLADAFEDLTAGWQTVDVPWRPRYVGDLDHFLACIRGDSAPLVTPAHDLALQEALLRASGVESYSSGGEVHGRMHAR